MKHIFKPGDQKTYMHLVTQKDVAQFESGMVHAVYSTFAIARDAEWSSRLFVLEMKDESEEGIGTFVNVLHKSPAKVGEEVVFTASVKSIVGNEIVCTIRARVQSRIIAEIETGQKILSISKLNQILS